MRYPEIEAEVGDTLVFNYMRMHDVRAPAAQHSRVTHSRITHHLSRIRRHAPIMRAGVVCGRHGLLLRRRGAAGGAGRVAVPARTDGAGALCIFLQRGGPLHERPGARARARARVIRGNERQMRRDFRRHGSAAHSTRVVLTARPACGAQVVSVVVAAAKAIVQPRGGATCARFLGVFASC
jgi:hypothetical protein